MVKPHKGFTLIEMLVTMVLLSSIILIGSSAYSLFSKRWDGQLGKFDQTTQKVRDLMLVHEVLDTMIPYIVSGSDNKPGIFFEGNRNGFVGVSTKSIFDKEYQSVIRLSVVQRSDFTFDVVYEEKPMIADVLRSTQESLQFPETLVLFKGVNAPKFEYFGWSSIEDKFGVEDLVPPKPPQWLPSYNAMNLPFPPEKVRFVFEAEGAQYELRANLAPGVPGLVSRYSGPRLRQRDDEGKSTKPKPEDDCYC